MIDTGAPSRLASPVAPSPWLLLYGVPGVGKTHLSRVLSSAEGWALFEADNLRDVARSRSPEFHDPALRWGTTDAYRIFGAPRASTIWRGSERVRSALQPWVVDYLRAHPAGGIAEAAFLDPEELAAWGQPCLVTCLPNGLHARRYFAHRSLCASQLLTFWIARRLQRLFLAEAHQLGIPIVNAADEDDALRAIRRLFRATATAG